MHFCVQHTPALLTVLTRFPYKLRHNYIYTLRSSRLGVAAETIRILIL